MNIAAAPSTSPKISPLLHILFNIIVTWQEMHCYFFSDEKTETVRQSLYKHLGFIC